TGNAIAGAMSKLVPPGRTVTAGPGDLYQALLDVAGGQSINLEGISGNLDFDLATGEPSASATPVLGWCLGLSGGETKSFDSGQRYDPISNSLRGQFSCPLDVGDGGSPEIANDVDASAASP